MKTQIFDKPEPVFFNPFPSNVESPQWLHTPTLLRDTVNPSVPWRLGLLSCEMCLRGTTLLTELRGLNEIREKSSEWKNTDNLKIRYVYSWQRIYTPQKVRKQQVAWDLNYFGWRGTRMENEQRSFYISLDFYWRMGSSTKNNQIICSWREGYK
jgi:hypothetical protein